MARDDEGITGPAPGAARERRSGRRGQLAMRAPRLAGTVRGELTDEDREWARRTAASLPPLTDRQRDILALLLGRRR